MTYSVRFEVDEEMTWENRLDNYVVLALSDKKTEAQWTQFIVTLVLLVFMTLAVVWAL